MTPSSRKNYLFNPKFCPSGHGAGGHSSGSFWEKHKIVCGLCGTKTTPHPTGGRPVYKKRKGLIGKFIDRIFWPKIDHYVDTYGWLGEDPDL